MTKDQRERLKVLNERLATLLNDHHPGLTTWCDSLESVLRELFDAAHELGIRADTLTEVILRTRELAKEGAANENLTPT